MKLLDIFPLTWTFITIISALTIIIIIDECFKENSFLKRGGRLE